MSSIYGYYSSAISSSTSTSLGISGLVSGMDIDATVEAMCSGTTSKISKVKQNLMKLQWKQEAYQDVGTALTDFESRYLSGTSKSGISSLLANCYNISAEGTYASAVSASGSAGIISDFSILGVSSLASTASYTTGNVVTSRSLTSGDIDFSEELTTKSTLAGKDLSFTIGSDDYTITFGDDIITDDASMQTALQNAINKVDGLADKLSVSVSDGKITMESKDASSAITISSGNSSTVLKTLGLQARDKVGSSGTVNLNGKTITGQAIDYGSTTKEVSFFSTLADGDKSFTLDLDGTKATVRFTTDMLNAIRQAGENVAADGDAKSAMLNEMVNQMQAQVDKAFGKGKVNITASTDYGEYTFSMETEESTSVLSVASGSSDLVGSSGILGISTGDANRLLLTDSLEESNFANAFDFGEDESGTYSLNINGVSFEIGKYSITVDGNKTDYSNGVTMKNVMTAINGSDAGVNISYLSTTDRFTITSTLSGAAGTVDISGSFADNVFGDGTAGSGTINASSAGSGTYTAGKDAELLVSFDGTKVDKITRSSNSFTLDGLTLTLSSTFNADVMEQYNDDKDSVSVKDVSDAVTFSRSVNTEEITEAVKQMVEDYNEIISKVADYYTTKPDSDYQPLTETMIKDEELTDDQAELYNNKAKEGILFGDSILRSLSDDLQYIFNNLSSIGITVSSDYKEYGKLSFDETTFVSALEADADKVADLFTNESTGALTKLDSLMDKYVNSSLTNPGLITMQAGLASSSLSQMNSSIYAQMQELNDQLSTLNDKLETQQDRYYNQFTNMEVTLSQLSSQSSYLTSMLSQ